MGIWCENDVVLTSMRRDYVASTLIRRHFGTKCPLGRVLSALLLSTVYTHMQYFKYFSGTYRISSVVRQSFFNPKDLDPSCKMDLDPWDCLGRVKFVL